MLPEIFDIKLQFSGTKPNYIDKTNYEVVQNDKNTNVFNFTAYDKPDEIFVLSELTTQTVTFRLRNGRSFTKEIQIVDATEGTMTYTLQTDELSRVGLVTATIELYAGENRRTSNIFTFVVREDLNNGKTSISTNSYPILTELLESAKNESIRIESENIRITNDISREENTTQAIDSINTTNGNIASEELLRIGNENTRQEQEGLRQSQESSRQLNTNTAIGGAVLATSNAQNAADLANEKASLADEKADLANSKASLVDEKILVVNEKLTAIDGKISASQTATQNAIDATGVINSITETIILNENDRYDAEGIRKSNETNRQENEITRQNRFNTMMSSKWHETHTILAGNKTLTLANLYDPLTMFLEVYDVKYGCHWFAPDNYTISGQVMTFDTMTEDLTFVVKSF